MKNKRGQFYLVGAIIIVLTLSGLSSIVTYAATKPSSKTINDLGNDLKTESVKIVDHGIYNEKDLKTMIDDFTDTEFAPYFLQKTDNSNVLIIYGNKSNVYEANSNLWAVKYDTVKTGNVKATIGGATTNWLATGAFANRTRVIDNDRDDKVTAILMGKEFEFELKESQMFYFVILKEDDQEIYVEKNG